MCLPSFCLVNPLFVSLTDVNIDATGAIQNLQFDFELS